MKIPLPTSSDEKGLSNWVTASLREAILKGHFEPGEKLDQDLIANELDVSRTPIREALKVLEKEGFVEIRSYKGAYIPVITQQDIDNAYEVRWVIESMIVRQATSRIPEEVLTHLEYLLDEEETATSEGDDRKFFSIDLEYHGTIASYSQNNLFKEILDNLNNRVMRIRSFAYQQSATFLETSHEEHLSILKAMQDRDAEKASHLMEKHLKNSADRIRKFIR